MAMTLVSTVTVGSGGAASIEFTNIPQTGKDLLVLVSGRATDGNYGLLCRFNSDSSNVTSRVLRGDNGSVSSTTFTGVNAAIATSGSTANTFGNSQFYVANYTSSVAKSFAGDGVNENNSADAAQVISANSWSGTATITTVTLTPGGAGFAQHTSASLYIIS